MSAPVISIIIPVYNASPYVEQCVRSVLAQTLQELEIIAVNDGSTDGSDVILDKLAAKDTRLKVFHLVNNGVSAARNFGLQQAKGSYIGFCDADDWMEPTMLEELYHALTTQACDWAICNVHVIKNDDPITVRLKITEQIIDMASDRTSFLRSLMRFAYDNANWNKLFHAAIIREQQLRFAEDMNIWEDLLFNLQYLQYVKRAALVAKPLYNYRIINTSLYNGALKDRVSQFNLLYQHYMHFAAMKITSGEEVFRTEMASIAYNQLLPATNAIAGDKTKGFFQVVHDFSHELSRFDPAVFYYPEAGINGLQAIKKYLLNKRRFGLFSWIVAGRSFIKSSRP